MDLITYQEASKRTLNFLENNDSNDLHMALGLVTEIGELADIYKRELAYGKPVDIINVKEEIGDIMWYLSNLCTINNYIINGFDTDYTISLTNKFGRNIAIVLDMSHHIGRFSNQIGIPKEMQCLSNSTDKARIISNIVVPLLRSIKVFCNVNDIDLGECLFRNIDKLYVRFPDKFDSDKALVRNLDQERIALSK